MSPRHRPFRQRLFFTLIAVAIGLAPMLHPTEMRADTPMSAITIDRLYRAANFVAAFSTPAERHVLSHYESFTELPPSYQTERLSLVFAHLKELEGWGPEAMDLVGMNGLTANRIVELTGLEATVDEASVKAVFYTMDLRTNLSLILAFDEKQSDGGPPPGITERMNLVRRNPSKEETHWWKNRDGAWRRLSDQVAWLRDPL